MREERFTPRDLEIAADDLATMKFFPHESRAAVMRQLAAMCPHKRALRRVIDECVAKVSTWPGMAELRGILCNYFEPADGIDAWSTLAGFSADDNEARYLEEHEEIKRLEQDAPNPFSVVCKVCEMTMGITTAGRPDDPKSVMVPCKKARLQ